MAKHRRGRGRRRRGLAGLASLGRITPGSMGREVWPGSLGILLAGGSTLAIRAFVRPDTAAMASIYRWAPAIGAGVGLVGAGAMTMVGKGAAMNTGIQALLTGGLILGVETLNASRPGGALATGMTMPAALPAGAAPTAGLGALVPETMRGTGLGVITMDPARGTAGAYGETVALRGTVNPGAFGRNSFQS